MNDIEPSSPGLSAADRCVKCGLCLPHCPTFTLTGNEADSPRGRISLMQMLETAEPPWSAGLFVHLDRCLQCRACEAMCPSNVPYGALMDTARVVIEPQRTTSIVHRGLRKAGLGLVTSPRRLHWLGAFLNFYRRTGLQFLIAKLAFLPQALQRANALLPPVRTHPISAPYQGAARAGTVNLFRGCAGRLFDQHTLMATQGILQALGYRVVIPDRQTCCGALHQHNGEPETALRLMQTNQRAFAGGFPVIGTASACTARLAEHEIPGSQVIDILHFLLQQNLATLELAPLAERVAVYIPCTHRNVLKQGHDLVASLELIPGIEPVVVNPQGGCCGAAGSYMLSQPEFSDRLRTPVIDVIEHSAARRVVTSNTGCALHLQAGLKQRGLELEVVHPVVLLERQLQRC